jgi:POT family proton-dependent oligopeptide transporter
LADKFFGLRRAVFYGGCFIALGHFSLAFPSVETFFLGLVLIVIGTGFLKPNISSLVGELYSSDDQSKRDAGFSIFFMGINIGASIAPIITGYLGERINWHFGFAAAGIGMLLGLVQYKLTEQHLGNAGLEPSRLSDPERQKRRMKNIQASLWGVSIGLVLLITLLFTKVLFINPVKIAQASSYVIGASALLYFLYVFIFEKLETQERKKIAAIGIFFLASAVFYSGFEQQGSSLNLFADRYTDMVLLGFKIPTSWLQSVPPVSVIILAPVFAWLWVWLSKRNLNPSTPMKLSFGLISMGLGYVIMMGASLIVVSGNKALPTWLIATYVLQEVGEICLYPVGLSAVTKLSPQRLVGQMMGIWFMSLAFGNLIAGLFAGEFDVHAIIANPQVLVGLFWLVAKFMLVAGVLVLILNKPIRKLMGEIR